MRCWWILLLLGIVACVIAIAWLRSGRLIALDRKRVDRQCLVTGGSRGIGFWTAKLLAERGDRVCILGKDGARLESAAFAINVGRPRHPVTVMVLDLANSNALETVALPDVDVLINNAAVSSSDDFITHPVNVVAPSILMKRLLPSMVERGYGRVLNISSWSCFLRPNTAYGRSKRALNELTLEQPPLNTNVSINALFVAAHTDMNHKSHFHPQEAAKDIVALTLLPDAHLHARLWNATYMSSPTRYPLVRWKRISDSHVRVNSSFPQK